MQIFIYVIIGFIAFQHFFFLYFEMFAWTTLGKKIFKVLPSHLFEPTKAMAANQGLYNGFLAAGLVWSLLISNEAWSKTIALFFLSCVAIAGLYAGYSVSKRIFFIQGIPAIIGIILLLATIL
jgi:putative membrane protein